jgi:MAF protein
MHTAANVSVSLHIHAMQSGLRYSAGAAIREPPFMQLVLASSSRYRRVLLERLRLPFVCASPDIDETPLPGESAEMLVTRLALTKARALASAYPDALLIGSDQACLLGERILGKPGTFAHAREQLLACSGRAVDFYTALALFNARTGTWQESLDRYTVHFRDLSAAEITAYLELEQPFDCAGSFKVEGLGITLFSALEGKDYHSLIGLPLLSLCELLRAAGLNPLLPTPAGPD